MSQEILTKEWFKERGYKEETILYKTKEGIVEFSWSSYGGKPIVYIGYDFNYDGSPPWPCKYAHELQHLYKLLTGEDLKV